MINDLSDYNVKHNNVLNSLLYYALSQDKKFLTQELIAEQHKIQNDQTFLAGLKNLYRNSKVDKLNKEIFLCSSEIEKLTKNKKPEDYSLCLATDSKEYINNYYKDDKYNVLRTLLGIEFLLMLGNKIQNELMIIRDISNIIFGDYATLFKIKTNLDKNYKSLASKSLSDTQKKVLIGVGVISIVALTISPILAVGGFAASAPATTSALAAIGFADMQIGVGMLALYGFLVGSTLIGATYLGMRIYNNSQDKKEYLKLCKEEFRKINVNDAKLFMSIKLTVIQQAKNNMPASDYKEYLSETLELLDSLREDNSYLLLVEKKNIQSGAEKMEFFHRVDNRLLEIS